MRLRVSFPRKRLLQSPLLHRRRFLLNSFSLCLHLTAFRPQRPDRVCPLRLLALFERRPADGGVADSPAGSPRQFVHKQRQALHHQSAKTFHRYEH